MSDDARQQKGVAVVTGGSARTPAAMADAVIGAGGSIETGRWVRSLSELPPVDLDAEALEIPLPIATQPVAEAEEERTLSNSST